MTVITELGRSVNNFFNVNGGNTIIKRKRTQKRRKRVKKKYKKTRNIRINKKKLRKIRKSKNSVKGGKIKRHLSRNSYRNSYMNIRRISYEDYKNS